MANAMRDALTQVLVREIDGFTSLESCQQLTAGASQETYRIVLNSQSGQQQLALRRAVPTNTQEGGVGSIGLEAEAQLFKLAGRNQIPAPQVVYVLQPDDQLGAGFLMQWLDGETLGQRINRSDELAEVRPLLARQCGEILGRIHSLDWQQAGLDEQLTQVDAATLVDETFAVYRELDIPAPMIDYCWRWLKANLPSNTRVSLVHGDFRNGNIMVNPQGINAVLDWELAHLGDPARDLGWLCVNSWRFGNREKPVGGFGELDDLLEGYRASSGITITAEDIQYWQVFGSFWWSITTLTMANSWRTGETPSLERPVIGRRSSEAQMDCVNLLIPGAFELPEVTTNIAAGTALPMPAELIEGVAAFLKTDVASTLTGRDAFLARVGANSLGIAQRELLYGTDLANAEAQRLQQLLKETGKLDELRWALSNRLREDFPLDTRALTEHLRNTVAGQLFIDQPKYSALHPTASTAGHRT